jgi:hypothetical protein|uniref:Uncharacterized protein n=1 Tax=Picea glauca TaxID=3330 RepID=A0A117NGA8_PICGL|nr:hypothetical protein ABT39_MTgene1606 [Picea glauca]
MMYFFILLFSSSLFGKVFLLILLSMWLQQMLWVICYKLLDCKGKKEFMNLEALLNVHFTDELTSMFELTQQSIEDTIMFLDTFAEVVGAVVCEEETKVFLIG